MSSKKDWRVRILHIRDEIDNILSFVEDVSLSKITEDKKTH